MTFLFWNLGHPSEAQALLPRLARAHAADVVIVAECLDIATVQSALNEPDTQYYLSPGRSRVEVFTRFSESYCRTVEDHHLYTLRALEIPGVLPLLFAAAHLPSGLQTPLESRNEHCRSFARRVHAAEAALGHRNTVVIGDFNLNPFDAGIAFAGGFHAVSDRRLAARGARIIQGEEFPFFYNPMWRFFGDFNQAPGSYYYRRADHTEYFWHLYDQVLIRPDLLRYFRDDGIALPATVDGVGLLNRVGQPDRLTASDHLPLVLRLHL